MDVGLVCFPLLFTACILAYILFRIVFQHGILTAGELCYSISKHIFFLLKHTVGHTVRHHLLAIHNTIGNGPLCFQTLVGSNVQTILYTEAQDTYRFIHILVQISLSQNTSVTLGIVHWTVRRIQMYQRVQAFLNVHACTECKGRTENHTHLATVYLFKDFKFFLDSHSRPHYHNLICRNPLCNQLIPDVIIKVEATLFVLVIVGKNGNRTFVIGCFFQRAQCLSNGFMSLTVYIIFGIRLYQSGIHGSGFGNTVHRERDVAVLFLLLSAHLFIMFKFVLYELHDATQCACLWQIKVLCLSSLHFGYFVLYAAGFFG